jgi:phosphatidylserine/phosphatidylglycerophosphate/cardiolipin synthase-like enzyme
MHHKFSIFDDYRMLNGSYNWTYAAEVRNDENVVIIENEQALLN